MRSEISSRSILYKRITSPSDLELRFDEISLFLWRDTTHMFCTVKYKIFVGEREFKGPDQRLCPDMPKTFYRRNNNVLIALIILSKSIEQNSWRRSFGVVLCCFIHTEFGAVHHHELFGQFPL